MLPSRLLAAAIALAVCSGTALAGGTTTPADADQVFVGGRFYTPTGWQTAMAVRQGRITALGDDAAVRPLAGPGTQLIELHGATVLPGMYDLHVHPVMAGNGVEGLCRLSADAPPADFIAGLAACVKSVPKGGWVTGAQWQAVTFGDTPITAATLDAVSPDHPVMLFDVSGHSLWVNSRALAIAGITRDSPNPEGGIIERDAGGAPTGVLRETARDLVLRHIPPPTEAQSVAGLRGSLRLLLSRGITGLLDAMVLRPDMVAYRSLADAGELKQHVKACIAYTTAGQPVPYFDELIRKRGEFARANFNPNCVKVFADGVPTESHTAAMLDPYAGGQASAPPRGLLLVDPKILNPAVARWDKDGLTVLFHAAGDGAVRASLDAIAYAREQNGMGGPRHQVGHSTFISREDIPRAKPLNATIEYSPYLWYPTAINDDIIKAIGPERIERVWPLREGIEAGGLVVAGSDWAVVPDPNPWLAIETAITRRVPGSAADSQAYGPAEAITLAQAIEMFTRSGALQLGLGDRLGALEAGKDADFIVLDRDPFAIPVTTLHKVQVVETWIGGERVYSAR